MGSCVNKEIIVMHPGGIVRRESLKDSVTVVSSGSSGMTFSSSMIGSATAKQSQKYKVAREILAQVSLRDFFVALYTMPGDTVTAHEVAHNIKKVITFKAEQAAAASQGRRSSLSASDKRRSSLLGSGRRDSELGPKV